MHDSIPRTSFLFVLLTLILFPLLGFSSSGAQSQQFLMIFLGLFVFVVAFLKTNVALGILILSMLLSPEIGVGKVADRAVTVRVEDIFLIVIFIAWLGKLAVFKELGLLKRTSLNKPILIYVFVCIVTTGLALIEGRVAWQRSLFYFLKYFEYFLLYFLVVNNIENLKQAKIFIGLLLVTCLIVSLFGLYSSQGFEARATAPFEEGGEPGTLAGYLVLMIPIMISLLFYSESLNFSVFLFGTLGISLLTLVFTLSRGGWVSFIFMYFVLIFITRKNRAILIAALVLAVVFGPLIAPKAVYKRVTETFVKSGKAYKVGKKEIVIDESGAARIDAWKIGMERVLKRPVLGYGIPVGSVIDNQYTRVMAETGIVGFLAFLYLLRMIYKTAYQSFLSVAGHPLAQGLVIGFIAGFFGLLVHCLSSATFILIRIMEPFWFLMAIIVLLPEFFKPPESIVIEGT